VIVGRDGRGAAAWTSPDGRNWQAASIAKGGQDLLIVAALGSDLLALGKNADGSDGRWASSDGGADWSPVPQSTGPGPANDASLFATPGGFIAVSPTRAGTVGLEIWNLLPGGTWRKAEVSPVSDINAGDLQPWSAASNGFEVVIAARTKGNVAPAGTAFCAGSVGDH
jgi:hypothetical protein